MLECLSFGPLTSSSASVRVRNPPVPCEGTGYSTEPTPVTSTQSSPARNVVSREFNRTIQGDSYQEIRSLIQLEVFDPTGSDPSQDHPELVDGYAEEGFQRKILEKVLRPDRDSVREALAQPKPNSLTRLVSTYFAHSEAASELCLLLHQSLNCARSMYAPLLDLLSVLPSDSNHITQSQCDNAFDVFSRFDTHDNPFPSRDSHNFSHMRNSFSELDRQLHRSLRKSRSKLFFLRGATNGSALCFIATAVGVVVSAIVVTTQSLVSIAAAAAPVCPGHISPPRNPKKKELARLAQLEAASKGTYTLNKDLDTIDRLVDRLHGAVEADKRSVGLGLEMGKNRYAMQEVIKHLRRDSQNFLLLMEELETRIYICLNFVNKTRWNLLREIFLHQTA